MKIHLQRSPALFITFRNRLYWPRGGSYEELSPRELAYQSALAKMEGRRVVCRPAMELEKIALHNIQHQEEMALGRAVERRMFLPCEESIKICRLYAGMKCA